MECIEYDSGTYNSSLCLRPPDQLNNQISRPTQHPLHSIKFLGPRTVRVLHSTSFVPTDRDVPRNQSSIVHEKNSDPRLQDMGSHKDADVSIDAHALRVTFSTGLTLYCLRMEFPSR